MDMSAEPPWEDRYANGNNNNILAILATKTRKLNLPIFDFSVHLLTHSVIEGLIKKDNLMSILGIFYTRRGDNIYFNRKRDFFLYINMRQIVFTFWSPGVS